jgi:UMF1 family MFS transporter
MALMSQDALNPGVRRRELFGWAMYDFANSGYTTVVLTAVFNAYFVGAVAGGAPWATLAWTCAIAASSLLVMFTMPQLGALADARAAKKRLLMLSTAACVACTAALAGVGPGDIVLGMLLIVLSNTFYTYGESLTASFLPELARPEAMGRVSGWGWSFGYFGGMLALGLSLGYVLWSQSVGKPASHFVPVTMLITAGLYGAAALVTFVWLKERAVPRRPSQAAAPRRGGLRQAWDEVKGHRDFRWLLACCFAYQAGIAVVIALAAVYAEQALGFTQTDTMLLVFLVNIAAAAGAFAFGFVQDRIGHQRALSATLLGWVLMTLLAWAARGPALFWVAAVLAGLCMGSSQSAARAMTGLLARPDRLASYFALWTFSVRLAAIAGPLTYGLVTWLTAGNHRLAILSTGLFFVAGWWLLRRVDLERGRREALEEAAQAA